MITIALVFELFVEFLFVCFSPVKLTAQLVKYKCRNFLMEPCFATARVESLIIAARGIDVTTLRIRRTPASAKQKPEKAFALPF